jgi:GrpB-like predicted nucleotidyltransferase (UPF0157 family)
MRKIEVVSYQQSWPHQFRQIAQELVKILSEEIIAVHHIGSTAVPGLAAKPIIDLLVEVQAIGEVDAYDGAMEAHGYLPKGEFGIARRRFFIKGSEEKRLAHVHMFERGEPAIQRHLAFRDYLMAHPAAAKRYGELKAQLAQQYPDDIDGYMAGKRAVVEKLEAEALAWRSG